MDAVTAERSPTVPVLVDRQGRVESLGDVWEPARYAWPRFSPDGSRVAVVIHESADADLWVLDLERGSRDRVTFGGVHSHPVWSPDGARLALVQLSAGGVIGAGISALARGTARLMVVAADGSDQVETILESDEPILPTSWGLDRHLAAYVLDPDRYSSAQLDLVMVSLDGEPTLAPLLASPFNESAGVFSPDGRWLAYVSNKSGSAQVYVRPYPGPGPEHVISTAPGREPAWSLDGRELYFRNLPFGGYTFGAKEHQVMAVGIETGGSFEASPPQLLFTRILERSAAGGHANYDVAPDGQHFLMLQPVVEQSTAPGDLVLVENWLDELERLVPID